jgi:predicted lipoprotein with Yx(FWY)xxD motif
MKRIRKEKMKKRSLQTTHKLSLWGIATLLVLALVLAACAPAAQVPVTGATDTPAPVPTAAPTATSAPTAAPAAGEASLAVATDPKLGKILVDDKGMTLYMYTKDTPNTSNCSANCLKAWPPLLTQGSPKLGAGIDASLVGNAKLADGTMIVTYNKMPLYYYAKDTKPGDVVGQDVGKVWYVVSPDGKVIGMDSSAAATPTVASAAGDVVINVATDPKLGKILVDAKGMTLYMYTKDTDNTSNCSANCLKAWPPFLTTSSAKAGDGVDASLIGSTKLADGTLIVTYNKMPLYYYAKDTKAGDVVGQDVGKVWYVVGPDGKPIGMGAAPAAAATGDVTINVATDPKLGKILVDDKGMTLYMYTKDTANTSNCSANCLVAWPPFLTKSNAKAGTGVDASLIGSTKLADGSMIVTYNKMPLYYYAKDTKAGDVVGQDVGKVWYVVAPDGKALTPAATGGY